MPYGNEENNATLNDLATGSKNAELFENRLKSLVGTSAEIITNFKGLGKVLGNNVNLLDDFVKLFKSGNREASLTTGIYSDIAKLMGMTSEQQSELIKKNKEEVEQQQQILGYLRQQLIARNESTDEVDKQLKANSSRYIQLQKETEAISAIEKLTTKSSSSYQKYLDKRKKATELAKTELNTLKEKARLEYTQTGSISEGTQAAIEQKTIEVSNRETTDANMAKLGGVLQKSFDKMIATIDGAFTKAESVFTQYQGSVNARLIGTDKTYGSMSGMVSSNLAVSALVSQQKVLDRINEAVKQGIAYNIEERAFLQTVSENVAETFNAFDSNLLRIIRLQQADSTAARMGLERELTSLFNTYFSDSSYMSDMYDSVLAELVEATSTMTRNQSVEFEATAQKWLGALYSIGLSNNAVQSIASGINLLGSGNVEALAGNTQLQNLLAMSASRAGMDYGNLLISGFNGGSELNDLMYSMVNYLAEIASSTSDNNVVRSAYGNVFNLSMSDWRAIANMGDTLSSIYSTNISYGQSTSSAQQGIYNMSDILGGTGIGMAAMMQNIMDNITFGAMANVVKNPALYLGYKIAQISESMTGGFQIPGVHVFGNGIDLNTSIEGLAKLATFGTGLMSSGLSNAFKALTGQSNAGWHISSWGGEDINTRGVRGSDTLSTTTGQSFSAQIGNASEEDMEDTLISNATDRARKQDKSKYGKDRKEADKTFDDLYYALFAPEAEAVLSTAGTSLTSINTEITTLNEEVRKAMHENAFNVNVKSFGGINMQSGIPVYFSGDTNSSGVKQMDGFISKFIQAFGINTDNTQDLEAYTLQDLVNFFIDTVGAEEGTGLNVNLAGNEVSATSFLTGQSGFERY